MPALMNYGRKGVNPFAWGVSPNTGFAEPDPVPPIQGPFDAQGMEYFTDAAACLVGFDIGVGNPNPDVWVDEAGFYAVGATPAQNAMVHNKMRSLDCWL